VEYCLRVYRGKIRANMAVQRAQTTFKWRQALFGRPRR
jgi:hypothetical protein